MHTCMAKEYTLINCMALGQTIYSLATQGPEAHLRFLRLLATCKVKRNYSYTCQQSQHRRAWERG